MAALEQRLLALPVGLDPKERLRRALVMLGDRERLEVMGFLQRAALADEASRRAAQDHGEG